jgi:hypothetical protein
MFFPIEQQLFSVVESHIMRQSSLPVRPMGSRRKHPSQGSDQIANLMLFLVGDFSIFTSQPGQKMIKLFC